MTSKQILTRPQEHQLAAQVSVEPQALAPSPPPPHVSPPTQAPTQAHCARQPHGAHPFSPTAGDSWSIELSDSSAQENKRRRKEKSYEDKKRKKEKKKEEQKKKQAAGGDNVKEEVKAEIQDVAVADTGGAGGSILGGVHDPGQ